MSVCSKTGLSKQQQERWPYLYRHLLEEIDIPDFHSVRENDIEKLDSDLKKLIKRIGDAKSKSRE